VSSNQYLIDAATRHQIFLQRYGAGRSKEAVKMLNQLRRKINARLATRADKLPSSTIGRRSQGHHDTQSDRVSGYQVVDSDGRY
jgi:hypothetical protein